MVEEKPISEVRYLHALKAVRPATEGEVVGRSVRSGLPLRLRWKAGRIVECEVVPAPPALKDWIAPPLVDLQNNGYAGIDFQSDGTRPTDLLQSSHALTQAGCTRFLLTLITDSWQALLDRLSHLRKLREQDSELKRRIVGWHIEGPFLSDQPGFHGAHRPAFMQDPQLPQLQALREIVGSDPLLLTVAPERKGVIEAIRWAARSGIKVSLGHTNATAAQIAEAVDAGASGFTHFGNGCPSQMDRQDNILWRVLDESRLTLGMIPDGIHLRASVFRVAHHVRGNSRIFYVTDAMAAAGAPPGRYRLGHEELEVGSDQVVRKPGQTTFAGSALRPIDGVLRAAAMLQEPWPSVWSRFSDGPAAWMGLNPGLQVGDPAEFCWIPEHPQNGFELFSPPAQVPAA